MPAQAAMAAARNLGLRAETSVDLGGGGNRQVLRLLPCDTVVRVARGRNPATDALELDVAGKLGRAGAPVTPPDPRVEPRVHEADGLGVTFWTYFERLDDIADPLAYARALEELHRGMRAIEVDAPHFTDRAAEALTIIDDPAISPELPAEDRAFLGETIRRLQAVVTGSGSPQQLIHGEPHPGNVMNTAGGLVFTDFETCCRGPVEFDVAHAPPEVRAQYRGVDPARVEQCRVLAMSLVAAWRWDRNDNFPDGRRMGIDFIRNLRADVAAGV